MNPHKKRRDVKRQTWMPHPAHFIASRDCNFRLATHVNGFVVSTVGEYRPRSADREASYEEIGLGRLYETHVYRALPGENPCCPFEADVCAGTEDSAAYNDAASAYAGHMAMLEKWGSK